MLTPQTPQSAPEIDKITAALNFTKISLDPHITKIFHYRKWTVLDALSFFAGYLDVDDDENGHYLLTLGGIKYYEVADKEIYDAFIDKYDTLNEIWKTWFKKEQHSKWFYIRWALLDEKRCQVTWLRDAQKNGFLIEPKPKDKTNDVEQRERNSLYRIIAALTATILEENSNDDTKPHLKNQSALIDYLTQQYNGYEGLSKSNLDIVIPAGKKLLK